MTDTKHAITTRVEHAAPIERMSPIVAAGMRILEAHPDPAALRELLAIQHTWEGEESRKAFERAMVALKRDLPTVLARDKTVNFTGNSGKTTNYTHTSLGAALEAITGPLTQHGFSLSWAPSTGERSQVSVTCRLTHTEGHSKEATISAPVDTSGNKSPAQGVASTITLLQRYTALSLLGIATADMQEPPPREPSPDEPNPERALRAVGKLAKLGKSRDEAEAYVGKRVQDWTNSDIESIAKWAQNKETE